MGKKSTSTSTKKEGTIKQGSIAEFMRKRTQLVGFDFGLNKHTQYAIEFIDNSIDAIESFQWKSRKKRLDYRFLLKDDILLENLSYKNGGLKYDDLEKTEKPESDEELVDDEGYDLNEDGEIQLELPEEHEEESETSDEIIVDDEQKAETDTPEEPIHESDDDEEAKKLRQMQMKEDELEQEVVNIMHNVEEYIKPVEPIVDREPFIIVRLREKEAQAVYADMQSQKKDVFEYIWEIFDNGTGMSPSDLEKFGKYLASSKSQKLKQTRGSQGFGSPSAFSDAQNTTGKPVTVVSKHINHLYGSASEFYTTSKNLKSYVVPPTEVDTNFSHGTYIKLRYLNVKYKRGYIDQYINLTALTNPHVTLIYVDPYGDEHIYPRRVGKFPREPTYALPHPSSVNIGDFQDLLRGSENITVSAFLQENFVRLSSSISKTIVDETEEDLEAVLSLLNLDAGFLTWNTDNNAPIYYTRYEDKIFGKSKKARKKLIVYEISNEENVQAYWEVFMRLNQSYKTIEKLENKIRKENRELIKEEDKKKSSDLKKEIKTLEKDFAAEKKLFANLKNEVKKMAKNLVLDHEVTDVKITDKLDDAVNELVISKTRPKELSQKQTESLYKVFKNQKYMSPPADPAVPIGASVLETTLMKEYGLSLSYRSDLFEDFDLELPSLEDDTSEMLTNRILAKFKKPGYLDEEFNKDLVKYSVENLELKDYEETILAFEILHKTDDDFIAGNTRSPTSGKGLAFVVEAAIAMSPKIPSAKLSGQVIMRYVNRTPKLRDNTDCALFKGAQSVNWKNYKLDTFDNGIPKGNIRILLNVSGPYVHLMFKSQSKNALAEDEVLLKEIKFCLEAIGRKIRNFLGKKAKRQNMAKRSKTIEKYIPIFMNSLMDIVKNMGVDVKRKDLEGRIMEALNGTIELTPEQLEAQKEREEQERRDQELFEKSMEEREAKRTSKRKSKTKEDEKEPDEEESREDSDEDDAEEEDEEIKSETSKEPIKTSPRPRPQVSSTSSGRGAPKPVASLDDILSSKKPSSKKSISGEASRVSASSTKSSKKKLSQKRVSKKAAPPTSSATSVPKPEVKPKSLPKPEPIKKLEKPKSTVNIVTVPKILSAFEGKSWLQLVDLVKLLDIKKSMDAKYLLLQLKKLTRDKKLLITIQKGKKAWKLNSQ